MVDIRSAAPAPGLRGADVDRVRGNALPAQQRGHPAPRVRRVGHLNDGVPARPQHPGQFRELVVRVGQVVQHPDHDGEVDAVVVERQLGGFCELPLEEQAGEDLPGQAELLGARVDQGDPVRVFGKDHGQPAETAADVRRVLVAMSGQQPAQRDELGLVLVVAARPELCVVK
ncbi:MAG: hypothetical protein ABSA02_07130 [Trebonia sp.]